MRSGRIEISGVIPNIASHRIESDKSINPQFSHFLDCASIITNANLHLDCTTSVTKMASVLQKYLPIDPPDPLAQEEDLTLFSSIPQVPTFSLPPVTNPTTFLRGHIDEHSNPDCHIKLAHGTTTLAFRFDGGIIVAVDSRATAGNWIASGTVKKGKNYTRTRLMK